LLGPRRRSTRRRFLGNHPDLSARSCRGVRSRWSSRLRIDQALCRLGLAGSSPTSARRRKLRSSRPLWTARQRRRSRRGRRKQRPLRRGRACTRSRALGVRCQGAFGPHALRDDESVAVPRKSVTGSAFRPVRAPDRRTNRRGGPERSSARGWRRRYPSSSCQDDQPLSYSASSVLRPGDLSAVRIRPLSRKIAFCAPHTFSSPTIRW
jgi:hypothetical protein